MDLGGLALTGSDSAIHTELTAEASPTFGTIRVNLADPASSLILTMPSLEDPADSHPNSTFTSTTDPGYVAILGWIQGGAPLN